MLAKSFHMRQLNSLKWKQKYAFSFVNLIKQRLTFPKDAVVLLGEKTYGNYRFFSKMTAEPRVKKLVQCCTGK